MSVHCQPPAGAADTSDGVAPHADSTAVVACSPSPITSQQQHKHHKTPILLLQACLLGDNTAGAHASATSIVQQLSGASAASRQLAFGSVDPAGWTPLLAASRNGWCDVLSACLEHSSSLLAARLHSSGNTAVHLAALHGQTGAVDCLLKTLQQHQHQHQHQLLRNSNGDTPLMFACSSGHADVAAALLDAGADAAASNASGITAVLAAAGHGRTACLELLLKQPQTQQQHAASTPQQLVAAQDSQGRNALHFAAAAGHQDSLELLLSACSPDLTPAWAISSLGRTPLQEAQLSGHAACAELLQHRMQAANAAADAAAAQLLAELEDQQPGGPAPPNSGGKPAKKHPRNKPAAGRPTAAAAAAGSPSSRVASSRKAASAGAPAGTAADEVAAAPTSPPPLPAPVVSVQDTAPQPDVNVSAAAASAVEEDGWVDVVGKNAKIRPTQRQQQQQQQQQPQQQQRQRPQQQQQQQQQQRPQRSHAHTATTPAPAPASATGAAKASRAVPQQPSAAGDSSAGTYAARLAAAAPPPPPPGGSRSSGGGSVAAPAPQLPPVSHQQQLPAAPTPPSPPQQQQHQQHQQPPWHEAASAAIAAALPAADDLDIQPHHVCGLQLESLSAAQLEALEGIHRAACARISQLRAELAIQQHAAAAAEHARLRAELAALAAVRKQLQQDAAECQDPGECVM